MDSTEWLSKCPIDGCRTIRWLGKYCSFKQLATRFLPLNVGGFLQLVLFARFLYLTEPLTMWHVLWRGYSTIHVTQIAPCEPEAPLLS